MENKCFVLLISGIVQGVGFRPYVYKLALELGLNGWVRNSPAGVEVWIEGSAAACEAFLACLKPQAPPASRVDEVIMTEEAARGESGFRILSSKGGPRQTLISPDLAICDDCLRELFEPHNRRYRYPFINCTNCGPRFTIIEGLPYDRHFTTMKGFPLCDFCCAEYNDPLDRRFHAQPIACATCGPSLSFLDRGGQKVAGDPLMLAQNTLQQGLVLAVKGLGGYHLACGATNEQAVRALRRRKLRWHKPFALMLPDLERAHYYCQVNAEEEELLKSPQRPIVLLRRKQAAQELAADIAPGQQRLGVMLPYTPVHHLLLEHWPALVMTSANFSDEPIVYEDEAAPVRLQGLADAYLTHDRPIFRRADDSVAVFAAGAPRLLRRSRGYAPQPLVMEGCARQILAVGGQEKNTFCLMRGAEAFISQHIGELDDAATYDGYRREIAYFCEMFLIKPQLIACDMHPDYLSSRYARASGLSLIPVQHHHAHLASVLAEHGKKEPVLGLIFDGTGYGLDGNLWGGEVLYGDCASFQRLAHLRYLPLAGGAAAIQEPWRQALAALYDACGENMATDPRHCWPEGWLTVLQSIKQGLNTPLSSGMGRLFDAVAALAGLHHTVSYEGQAAIALEQCLDNEAEGAYCFVVNAQDNGALELDWRPVIAAVAADIAQGQPAGAIAARFHRAVAGLCLQMAVRFREEYSIDSIALSGGCWQNIWLLEQVTALLSQAGFTVLSNSAIPVNDGGLALGQAAIANAINNER